MSSEAKLPDKLFFKIGEVARIVGVRPHVLRYWENEFSALRPMKTRGLHRVYRRKDVELAVLVKHLLHDEGLTMSGAKRRLREWNRDRASEPAPAEAPESRADTSRADASRADASRQVNLSADLLAIRRELAELLKDLDRVITPPVRASTPAPPTMTVTSAVPSTVPITTTRTRLR